MVTEPDIKMTAPSYNLNLDPLYMEMGSFNDVGYFNFSQDLVNNLGQRNGHQAQAFSNTKGRCFQPPLDALSHPANLGRRANRPPGYAFVSWLDHSPAANQFNSRLSNFSMPSQTPEYNKRQAL